MSETVLEEAARITSGARGTDYGHPLDNHSCTAELWRSWLRRKYGVDVAFTPEDVCYFNILQKLSREANAPKRDTIVDLCGFSRNVEMVQEERRRRAEGGTDGTTPVGSRSG
jgi:hypothetical protein